MNSIVGNWTPDGPEEFPEASMSLFMAMQGTVVRLRAIAVSEQLANGKVLQFPAHDDYEHEYMAASYSYGYSPMPIMRINEAPYVLVQPVVLEKNPR